MPGAWDVIVAGVGASGSAAVCELARRGLRVLGLDRFTVPNTMSSHHGVNRIIRLAYFEGSAYVPLVRRAYELWQRLERDSGQRLLHVTGSLDLGPVGGEGIEGALRSCREHGLTFDHLDGAEIARRFPAIRVPEDYAGVFQPDGGFLASEDAVAAHAALARRFGAEIRTGERVLGWTPDGDGVTVRTEAGKHHAGRLVLSCGPWIGDLVPALAGRAVPVRQILGWFGMDDATPFQPDRFPVFVLSTREGRHFYGFPEWGVRGFKIGCHHHLHEKTDPDGLDRTLHPRDEALLRGCVSRFFPGADGPVLDHRACLYTVTADEDFVIDLLPDCPQVVVASPCSGHGFKFATAVGEIVADLAGKGATGHDIGRFGLARLIAGASPGETGIPPAP